MDLDSENFIEKLPDLLLIISCADYVAIDLEMSGIRINDGRTTDGLTLDDMYHRIAAAASTFQAMQLGLTAVHWKDDHYRSYTCTIPITPMFADTALQERQLAEFLDRRIIFSQSTLTFLCEHDFDIGGTLGSGVSYLSRQELSRVKDQFFRERRPKPIDLNSLDGVNARFLQQARESIKEWLDTGPSLIDKLKLFDSETERLRAKSVNVVSQLVSNEFPLCRSWRQGNGVCVALFEPDFKEEALSAKEAAVGKQLALPLLIEALFGGEATLNLEDIDEYTPLGVPSASILESLGQDTNAWQEDGPAQLKKLTGMNRTNRPVIIGHSVIFDLCFLYSTFIGQLPKSVVKFHEEMRKFFPRLVDTRLLTADIIHPDAIPTTLGEIYRELECQNYPYVDSLLGWGFNKTGRGRTRGKEHSAGFDSYMTAMVFMKLCCRRWRRGRRSVTPPDSPMDRYLSGDEIHLPDFTHKVFASFRNKLRMANAGVLDLDADTGIEDAAPNGGIATIWREFLGSAKHILEGAEEGMERAEDDGRLPEEAKMTLEELQDMQIKVSEALAAD